MREREREREQSSEICPKCSQQLNQEKIHYDKEYNRYFCSKICADFYSCKENLKKIKEKQGSSKIQKLESEISSLENSPHSDKTLLNMKREELAELEKKLNQESVQEQKSSSKLYWGIGLGIFGVGLLGVLVWLVLRKKKDNYD